MGAKFRRRSQYHKITMTSCITYPAARICMASHNFFQSQTQFAKAIRPALSALESASQRKKGSFPQWIAIRRARLKLSGSHRVSLHEMRAVPGKVSPSGVPWWLLARSVDSRAGSREACMQTHSSVVSLCSKRGMQFRSSCLFPRINKLFALRKLSDCS